MGKTKQIIDLFSGVGGLSLGASRAGFEVRCAVDLDEKASALHTVNFPGCTHLETDVSRLSGDELLRKSEIDKARFAGLIGGPPCQGFSEIGHRSTRDPRNALIRHFFRLVAETEPPFFLAENVPGILDPRNKTQLDSALALIPSRYCVLDPMIVKASDYGVPTRRTRVFFYGYDPERVAELTSASFAARWIRDVRVKQGLACLPKIRSEWLSETQSWRAVGSLGQSSFARNIMDNVPAGVGDPTALALYKKKRIASGFLGTIHEAATKRRFKALKHGERDEISKAIRLDPEGYCPTLLAGTGPERGSYQALRPIHPSSPRVISPREGARLQGFPDWFQFHPTKWHAFRQIGNSVSPIVAENLLNVVRTAMR